MAALAKEVDRLAREGDGAARRILEEAAEELSLLAQALCRRLGTHKVALWGSVFESALVVERFLDAASRRGLEVVASLGDVALYAALWAQELVSAEGGKP